MMSRPISKEECASVCWRRQEVAHTNGLVNDAAAFASLTASVARHYNRGMRDCDQLWRSPESLRGSTRSALLIDAPSPLKNLNRLSPSLPGHRRRGPIVADLQDLPPALFISESWTRSLTTASRFIQGGPEPMAMPALPLCRKRRINRLQTRLAAKIDAFGRRWLSEDC